MEWPQFFIKILGINFGNSIFDNSNWDKISEGIIKTIHIWKRMRLSLRRKKIIVNQILLSKLWYTGQIYIFPKYIKKKIEKIYNFLWNGKNAVSQTPSSTLSIWRGRLSILEIDTQLKYLKIKWIQRLSNSTSASLERSHTVLIEPNSEF